jgi:hypothetical protein
MKRSGTGIDLNDAYVNAVERPAELARLISRADQRNAALALARRHAERIDLCASNSKLHCNRWCN